MTIEFNNIKPRKPQLFVAKPNMAIISKLKEAFNIQYNEKLTELSELSFTIPFKIDQYLNLTDNENINLIKEKYLIKLTVGSKQEWFVINKITDKNDSSDLKEVHAISLGYELADKNIREFKTESKNAQVTLTELLSETVWTIGYIDSLFLNRYRDMDISSSTVLESVIQTAETFNALIVWDTANRKINFYQPQNIGNDTGMIFSYRKYLQSVSQESSADEMVTRLKAYGKDGLTIEDVNPTGTPYIEDFSYFMYPYEQKDSGVDISKLKGASVYYDVLDNYTKVISDIAALNLNNITIPIIVEFANGTSSTMAINNAYKNKAITLIQEIKKVYSDIKIIIEPYPLVLDGTPETELNPSDLNSFFWNWKTVILEEITSIANTYNAYGVYISSNLQKIEYATGYWQGVISFVKGKFSGKVIYRTNFWTTAVWSQPTIDSYNAKLNNALFNDVDIISVSAYFELNEDRVSTVSQLESDLRGTRKYGRNQNIYQEVKNFFDKYNKKIFFGELGFASKELASSEPWNNYPSTVDSEDAQANLFQAYRNVFENQSWCIGFSVFAITNGSPYDVVGKKAEKVISSWYATKIVIKHSDYMSDDLCKAIIDYNILVSNNATNFQTLLSQLSTLQTELTTLQSTLDTYNNELLIIQNSLDVAKSLNDTATITAKEIEKSNKLSQIATATTSVNNKKTAVSNKENEIKSLKTSLSIETNFTPTQISERNLYVIEKEWTDERLLDSNELYKMAQEKILELRTPQISATLDIVNFLDMVTEYENWDRLSIGDTVRVKNDISKIDFKAKVTEISYDYENKTIRITISNLKKSKDQSKLVMDLLYKGASTSNTVNMNKFKWDTSHNVVTEMESWFNQQFDATKQEIIAGVNNSIEIGRRGIIIKNSDQPLKQLIAQNGVLALTNDGGNTWKTAITPDGVVAERIAGKLLVGANLSMENQSGKFKFDKDGVTIDGAALTITGGIKDQHLDPALKVMKIDNTYSNGIRIDSTNGIVVTKSDNKAKVTINATEGIRIDSGTGFVNKVFSVDTNGNLNITGNFTMNGGSINWSNVTKPTYTAADVGALSTSSPMMTYIDQNGIYTGSLTANQIVAGTISANRISGGTISGANISTIPTGAGTSIDVWSDVLMFKSNGNVNGLIGQSSGYLYFSAAGLNGFMFDGSLVASSISTSYLTVGGSAVATESYISSQGYTTQSWVQSQGYMSSLPYSAYFGGYVSVGGSLDVSARADFYNNVYMSYNLTVDGRINGTTVGSSDINFKKNINEYSEDALNKVLNTKVYTYHYTNEADTDQLNVGLIAQEAPNEIVVDLSDIESDANVGINLYGMSSMLWKSNQQMYALFTNEINNLKEEIRILKEN